MEMKLWKVKTDAYVINNTLDQRLAYILCEDSGIKYIWLVLHEVSAVTTHCHCSMKAAIDHRP